MFKIMRLDMVTWGLAQPNRGEVGENGTFYDMISAT